MQYTVWGYNSRGQVLCMYAIFWHNHAEHILALEQRWGESFANFKTSPSCQQGKNIHEVFIREVNTTYCEKLIEKQR